MYLMMFWAHALNNTGYDFHNADFFYTGTHAGTPLSRLTFVIFSCFIIIILYYANHIKFYNK